MSKSWLPNRTFCPIFGNRQPFRSKSDFSQLDKYISYIFWKFDTCMTKIVEMPSIYGFFSKSKFTQNCQMSTDLWGIITNSKSHQISNLLSHKHHHYINLLCCQKISYILNIEIMPNSCRYPAYTGNLLTLGLKSKMLKIEYVYNFFLKFITS